MIVFFKRFVVSVFLVQVFLVACFGQNVQIAFDGLGDGSLSELKDDYQELIDPLVEALEFSTQEYLTVFDVSLANGYQFTSIELGSEEIHKQHLSLYDPTFTGLAVTYTYDRITARYEVFGSLLLSEDTNECIANNLINSTLLSPQSQEDYKLLMGDFQLDVEKVLDIIQRALCCLDQRSQLGNKLTRQEQRQALICEGVDFNLYFILMQKLMQSEEWKSMIITVDSLKEVLAPCIESEWKPYHEPGVIPKCFYSVDGVSVLPTAPIASGLNSASFVGVLDELGAEVIGLINLPKFAMTTADYVRMYISAWTTFYLSCEEYSYNEPTLNLVFHDLIDSLEIQDPSFNTIYQSHFTVDPGTLSMTGTLAKLVIPTLIIPTSQADCDTLGKIRTSVREILSFDSDIIEMSLIVDSIFSSVIDSTIAPFNLDSTNSFESSYWTGRYMIRTALIFEAGYTITRGGIKLLNKYLRRNSSTIASKTRAISQATRAEHAADLLEEIEKANGIVINPSARKQLISAIASNPRISDFIILKRAKGAKAWEKLSKSSVISGQTKWLNATSRWIDEGYEFVETSTGVIIKSGDDVVVEIVGDIPKLTKHGVRPKAGTEVLRKSDDVNAEFVAAGFDGPYHPNFPAIEFNTSANESFVRVFKQGSNAPDGRWMAKQSDIAGMSPQQIKEHLALPELPDRIVSVDIPANVRMRTGKVKENFGAQGGGIQFELPHPDVVNPSWFGTPQSL